MAVADVPLYSQPMVEEALNRVIEVPFEHPLPILEETVRVTFFPAGHILGAALVTLISEEGKVLFTGDLSVSPQKTVGGAAIPRGPFDLVISESTYGSRFHPNRDDEERRLAETVAATIKAGGFVLIPAFAIGRAQEVLLVLAHAMETGGIPEFPVYADGMVTRVCSLYRDFPNDVSNGLAKRISKYPHPFFSIDGPIRAVLCPKDREAILRGPPAAIVSSSGMLSGGPSVWYAAELAPKPGSLIAITGYQDEEAPGRRLMELAEGSATDRVLRLGSGTVPVACSVAKYGLSAHADGSQISRFISAVKPHAVALVHGDEKAREDLWSLIRSMSPGLQVHLPPNGGSLTIETRRHARAIKSSASENTGIGGDRFPENDEDLGALHSYVCEHFLPGRFFTARELFNIFCGPTKFDPAAFENFRSLLKGSRQSFLAKRDKPFLFRPVAASIVETKSPSPRMFMEQNAALQTARSMFDPTERLMKIGVRPQLSPPVLVLTFAFPEVAAGRCSEKIARLAEVTGHSVEVNRETAQNALSELLVSLLPPETRIEKTSFHRGQRKLKLRVSSEVDEKRVQAATPDFLAESGITLEAVRVAPAPTPAFLRDHRTGRFEINAAFAAIGKAFEGRPNSLFKKSLKTADSEEFIELGFLTPAVGEKFRDLLEALSFEIGWKIRIGNSFQQQALAQVAIGMVGPLAEIKGNPAFRFPGEIAVKVSQMPAPEIVKALQEAFQERAGIPLRLL